MVLECTAPQRMLTMGLNGLTRATAPELAPTILMSTNEARVWSEGQFETAVMLVTKDPIVRQQMIEAGTADITFEVPLDNIAIVAAQDDVTLHANPSFQSMLDC